MLTSHWYWYYIVIMKRCIPGGRGSYLNIVVYHACYH